ncbi:MAG: aldehyde dehydrogenase family protein [Acidimicrobiales bacterium]|jgi:aldehyde dehydrogenase (NAD+)
MSALPTEQELAQRAREAMERCGVESETLVGERAVVSPINGRTLHSVRWSTLEEVRSAVDRAYESFLTWRTVPAPQRGAVVKHFGELLTTHKQDLASLITLEVGKITSEALGEVQEMIDVCDFATGLSRQLYGRTMPSERAGHRMMETWHPLGVVGVISAFNFPTAVWSWNAAIALVCGDSVVWKPSELAPLSAMASAALLERALRDFDAPPFVSQIVLGSREVGEALVDDDRVALVSATGSTRMGREVGPRVASRFGRCLLELGGNNAAVVTPSADLSLATRGIVFAAAGTAGQRCTTMRRVIAHVDIVDELTRRLAEVYGRLPIGSPLDSTTLVGPLIHGGAFASMQSALEAATTEGGTVVVGGERRLADVAADAFYVEPAIVRMVQQTEIVRRETFAPLLYVMAYDSFDDAIAIHNDVPQGLSSSIFTSDHREAERFMSASDCGIVNVNIGTSGAEIGGAFGGEKETGGGRESGSDAWRAYMRRATNTVNFSGELPLAQGVEFSV